MPPLQSVKFLPCAHDMFEGGAGSSLYLISLFGPTLAELGYPVLLGESAHIPLPPKEDPAWTVVVSSDNWNEDE